MLWGGGQATPDAIGHAAGLRVSQHSGLQVTNRVGHTTEHSTKTLTRQTAGPVWATVPAMHAAA
jgi:hypothetical protein